MQTVASEPVRRVVHLLGDTVKPCINGYEAKCPAHEDKRASLSISQGSDGTALLHCHAGCEPAHICSRMGIELKDLFPPREKGGRAPPGPIVATYPYRDEQGGLLFEVTRHSPKDFRQRSPDGQGDWTWSIKGVRQVPYQLPELTAAVAEGRTVFVVEGEKDVHALVELGLSATCNAGGAGKWRPVHTEALKGAKRVVVVADKDEAGRKHARTVAEALTKAVGEVLALELPGEKVKDAADWRAAGGTRAQLEELVKAAPRWTPELDLWTQKQDGAEKKTERRAFGTDTWLAELLVSQHGQDLRYCGPWKKWLTWSSGRWRHDESGQAERWLKETIRSLFKTAAAEDDRDKRNALFEFATKSESERARRAALVLARYEAPVQVNHNDFDADPMLLNVGNGVVDLRTGRFRQATREDLNTKQARVEYAEGAGCPTWLAFLDRIFAGDQEMISFVQRAAGYSLTGDVGEHAMFVLHGGGANGKSTLTEVLMDLLGGYAAPAPQNFLVVSKHERHPAELALMFKLRMVVCQESGQEHRFDEAKVKLLTGGDVITARRLHEGFWDFLPSHKLWLCTNHRPQVRGNDEGIWRRIKLIPFEVQIPGPERDKHLKDKLRAEMPGILNWAIAGALAWREKGLAEPAKVIKATEAYRVAEDRMGGFLTECCMVTPAAFVTKAQLYEVYRAWATANGEYAITKKAFGTRMQERGFNPDEKDKNEQGQRVWFGIGLLSNRASDAFDMASG